MENKAYIIEGKIDKKHKLVAFELPALIITKLKIVYNRT
jgi:hypothetical protein